MNTNAPLFGLVAMAVLVLSACGKEAPAQKNGNLAKAQVRVAKAESRKRISFEEAPGSVQAKLHADIEAKISGRIEKLAVVPGQSVKAGDILVELDAREVRARLDQAMALRDQADQELKRVSGLFRQQVASQQELDAAQARARVADAAATEAETMMGYAKVLAPFSGVVTRKHAQAGDMAAPGKLLMELEDPSALRLEADVPESLIGSIAVHGRFMVTISSSANSIEAVCDEIAPVADPGSRTFLVKFDLPQSSGARSGQFGRVLVPVGESECLRVPASAVVVKGQMEIVFTADEGRAQLRLVKTGKRVGDEVEIVSGLSAGEEVVIENAVGLVDGQPLYIPERPDGR